MAIDLNSLQKTPEGSLPPIITIYGVDGIGKTPFGLGGEKPIYLPTEKRFTAYGVVNAFQTEDNKNKICESFAEMCNALIALSEQRHDFKTVVVDSLDHLEPMVWDVVLTEYPYVYKGEPVHKDDPVVQGARKIESIVDYGYGKGYALAMDKWRFFFNLLQKLRDAGMTVVLIAHYQQKQENPADDDMYDQFQLKLHKNAAHLTRELSDLVLFMKIKQLTKSSGKGFNETRKAVGPSDRVIVCKPSLSYTVKNSFSLPDEIPMAWSNELTTEQNCQMLYWSVAQHIPYFNKQQTQGE